LQQQVAAGSRSGPPLTKALMQQEMHDINTSLLSLTEVVKLINKNASHKQVMLLLFYSFVPFIFIL
jgi:hypothetical protein